MGGEGILHYGAVRMRVVGTGSLQMKFQSLDETIEYTILPLIMTATTDREPTRLANFKSQRAALELKTTEKDEIFRIQKIIVFARSMYTSYPG